VQFTATPWPTPTPLPQLPRAGSGLSTVWMAAALMLLALAAGILRRRMRKSSR
jgi:LPXTG-motif cell wall-anchored protein